MMSLKLGVGFRSPTHSATTANAQCLLQYTLTLTLINASSISHKYNKYPWNLYLPPPPNPKPHSTPSDSTCQRKSLSTGTISAAATMPPPSESDILTNYLLQPAPLPSITTFNQFVLLFPRPLHNSPQLRSLYRDLQAQRNAVVDAVAASIQDEVKRGVVMRREVLRLRREAEREDIDGEVEMERAVSC